MDIALPFIVVLVAVLAYPVCRDVQRHRARAWADKVIAGSLQAGVHQINRCISQLDKRRTFGFVPPEQDRYRIERLRDIRNRQATPPGQSVVTRSR